MDSYRNSGAPARCRILTAAVIGFFALVAPVSALATHSASEPSDGTVASFRMLEPPRAPPPFQFLDAGGRTVTLADFRGKVLLLNLWATWCAPCIREMPALDRLQAKLGKEEFLIVPISLDKEGRPAVEAFYERLGLRHLEIYLDPTMSIEAAFPVDVLPANFLVDREGRVTGFLRSYVDWEAPEAEAMIRGLLSASATGQ
ncbi:MAG: TlpA family protein disulfide reductase [Rhodospirillales bacterium]|nr:MAG: TlpA family protein disulfide reductase [Rhodospirillales bacterium]